MSYLNCLSYNDLINLISTIPWDDIVDFFEYNSDAYDFYINQNRVQALIDAIVKCGSEYTTTDTRGIPTVIEVLRAGYYLGFYYDKLKYLDTIEMQDKCISALISIENNKNFRLGTRAQDDIVSSFGLLMWNTSCNIEIVNKSTTILA